MTSTSSPMHSGAFNFESKFQNNLFTLRMAIQCRRRNGNTIKPNLYSDGTFMMKPRMFVGSIQNGSLQFLQINQIVIVLVHNNVVYKQNKTNKNKILILYILSFIKPNGFIASQLKCTHDNIYIVLP